MSALWLLVLATAPPLDEAAAAAALQEIRAGFATRPTAETDAALARLAADAPSTQAAGLALVWRGDLALSAGDPARARASYEGAYAIGGEARRLGARGLGDVALGLRQFARARGFYLQALDGASPLLAAELRQKLALTARLGRRTLLEWLSWGLLVALIGYFAWRARPWRGLGAPGEALYVLPVYLLLIVGGVGRDARVLEALMIGAAGSLTLIAAAGMAAARTAGRARWAHLALLVVGNLALFYASAAHAGLLDALSNSVD
jgi:hypothetical protein